MPEHEIICIGCPMGCRVTLTVSDQGEVVGFDGNKCKEGERYATDEFRSPVRVFTTTVLTEGSVRPLLPARTNKPITKGILRECMSPVSGIKVKPPVRRGDVIIPDIMGTGVDLISTEELLS
jgi:CxxC motif-containing protein